MRAHKSSKMTSKHHQGLSAPVNRRKLFEKHHHLNLKPEGKKSNVESIKQLQVSIDHEQLASRSRKLSVCLLCLAAAVTCLTPYLSLHLTQRVGLLLFESDLIQLRSSLFSVIICLSFLVIVYLLIYVLFNRKGSRSTIKSKSLFMQKSLSYLIGLFAIISAISYLSLALIVPQIKQIQRMPTATFDCNANLITIENCHQQFTFAKKGDEQTIYEALTNLLIGDYDFLHANQRQTIESSEKSNANLIKKLQCLKYNDNKLNKLEIPSRFLLHHCDLVCKPQRYKLFQFNDDLNDRQHHNVHTQNPSSSATETMPKLNGRMIPPYQHDTVPTVVDEVPQNQARSGRQVSLKVCFSGELSGGSDYKQFCITNLANSGGHHDHTMTVGQLNAMLKKFPTSQSDQDSQLVDSSTFVAARYDEVGRLSSITNQATNYENPIVQFESHFKSWPQVSSKSTKSKTTTIMEKSMPLVGPLEDSILLNEEYEFGYERSWCKFRPIPPFIVDNKPFNDIQCSLEHEYTMTTMSSQSTYSNSRDEIHLKKTKSDGGPRESDTNLQEDAERCNIECKVNILYKIQLSAKSKQSSSPARDESSQFYYLPLKPCVVVLNDGDKSETFNYYLLFRSLGDSTLLLVFILLDLFLLLESIDKRESQFKSRKYRIVGLLLALTLTPVAVALLFDLFTYYAPPYTISTQTTLKEGGGYLSTWLTERLLPTLVDMFKAATLTDSATSSNQRKQEQVSTQSDLGKSNRSTINTSKRPIQTTVQLDSYLVPMFIYSVLMFVIVMNSWSIPLVSASISANLDSISSIADIQTTAQQTNQQQEVIDGLAAVEKRRHRQAMLKMISFLIVVLFMGTQFNLSQITQTQLMVEAFGDPGSSSAPASAQQASRDSSHTYAAFRHVLSTQSAAIITILLLVLLFADEVSTFLGETLARVQQPTNDQQEPHKATVKQAQVERKRAARLFLHLTLALIIYSVRYYALSSLNSTSRSNWLAVSVFQIAEIFNFPLVWLTLTTLGHEMIADESKTVVDLHLIVQSTLGLNYFGLGRLFALLAHSLYVSLHLHSDNVDWFITSFYNENKSSRESQNATNNQEHHQSSIDSLFSPLPGERQTYLHATRLFLRYNALLCLLVGLCLLVKLLHVKYQLWSEKQKHRQQHSSNEPKSKQPSPTKKQKPKSFDEFLNEDHLIAERLSLDLMNLHSSPKPPKTTTATEYYSTGVHDSRTTKHCNGREMRSSPRAKILFHYNLNRLQQQESSDDLDKDDILQLEPQLMQKEREVENWIEQSEQAGREPSQQGVSHKIDTVTDYKTSPSREVRIPIAMGEDDDEVEVHEVMSPDVQEAMLSEAGNSGDELVERVISKRSKRVALQIDGPIESDREKTSSPSKSATQRKTNTVQSQDNREKPMQSRDMKTTRTERVKTTKTNRVVKSRQTASVGKLAPKDEMKKRRRSITFAPTATLIGTNGAPVSERQLASAPEMVANNQQPQRASPDPSVGSEDEGWTN